jgi:hypothetical protein
MLDLGDYLEVYGQRVEAEVYWRAVAAFDPQQVEDESIATAHARLAYLAAERGQRDEALRLGRTAHQLYLRRGAVRYYLRLEEWLKNYADNGEIDWLLDLARFED